MRRFRLFVLAASLALVAVSSVALKTEAATLGTIDVKTSSPLVRLVVPTSGGESILCSAEVYGSFNGVNNNGVVSGTWSPWFAETSCTSPMLLIEVHDTLTAPWGVNYYATPDLCEDPCGANFPVQANGAPVTCTGCNGEWIGTGTFDYQFPYTPGSYLVFDDNECHYDPNSAIPMMTVECTLTGTAFL